jgi:hypothetical protein
MKLRAMILCAVTILESATIGLCQAPANDNFTNAIPLGGSSLTFAGTLAGATIESGEPLSSCSVAVTGGSVWWTWTAPTSTTVVIAILRDYATFSASNTWLQVCSGTNLGALAEIDCNRFDGPANRYVKFAATEGVVYQFRVFGGWGGSFSLELTATNPPVLVHPPVSCTVSPYGSAFFWTVAAGLPAPKYQWTFNGTALPGETSPILAIHNVQADRAGGYSVIVSNSGGVTEGIASLIVTDTNPVPQLAALPPGGPGLLTFGLTGEAGRWYEIESASDLGNWTNPGVVFYTNVMGLHSVSRFDPEHQFVRASLNVSTDVCMARLLQFQAALNLYLIESKVITYEYPTNPFNIIRAYLPTGTPIICPDVGTYAIFGDVSRKPSCTLESRRGHQSNDLP